MAPRGSRRLLAFLVVAALLAVLAAVGYYRLAREPTTEERAREKAEELRRRVEDLTHGK